jgi:hypothetical protein
MVTLPRRRRLSGRPPAGFRAASRVFVYQQMHGGEPLFFAFPRRDLSDDGLTQISGQGHTRKCAGHAR